MTSIYFLHVPLLKRITLASKEVRIRYELGCPIMTSASFD
jgi:hypothetical protein